MNDMYIVSYPRSGNTWVRRFLSNLIFPTKEWNLVSMNYLMPDVYFPFKLNITGTDPRFIKSHQQYTKRYKKVIYLYRDPRDVVISYWNYTKTVRNIDIGSEEFFMKFIKGDVLFGSWGEHVKSWLFDKHDDLVLQAFGYEEMCYYPHYVLSSLAKYAGQKFTNEGLSIAIKKSSFSVQQKDVKESNFHYDHGYRGGVKGGPGKWKTYLTKRHNELMWGAFGDMMEKLGYEKAL